MKGLGGAREVWVACEVWEVWEVWVVWVDEEVGVVGLLEIGWSELIV